MTDTERKRANSRLVLSSGFRSGAGRRLRGREKGSGRGGFLPQGEKADSPPRASPKLIREVWPRPYFTSLTKRRSRCKGSRIKQRRLLSVVCVIIPTKSELVLPRSVRRRAGAKGGQKVEFIEQEQTGPVGGCHSLSQ